MLLCFPHDVLRCVFVQLAAADALNAMACRTLRAQRRELLREMGRVRDVQADDDAELLLRIVVWDGLRARRAGDARRGRVAAGSAHSLCIDDDGCVWHAGLLLSHALGSVRQTAFAPCRVRDEAANVLGGVAMARVAAGAFHSVAISRCGRVFTWGLGLDGRLGRASMQATREPTLVPGIRDAAVCAAGCAHTLVADSKGECYAWGDNVHGQLGTAPGEYAWSPGRMRLDAEVVGVAAGEMHTLLLMADGRMKACGRIVCVLESYLGAAHTPISVDVADGARMLQVAAAGYQSASVALGGRVYTWGAYRVADVPAVGAWVPRAVPGICGVTEVAVGAHHCVARLGDGRVLAWGRNTLGQLGVERRLGAIVETPAPTCDSVRAIDVAAGDLHTLLLCEDETRGWRLWACGYGCDGRLGLDTCVEYAPRAVPWTA